MRDLLTNIKKAIEILNKNKNLTIQLTDPGAFVDDRVPVGVSRQEFEENLTYIFSDLLFTADDIDINFDCTFDIKDVRVEENNSTRYMEAMQRIIKEIYDRYKWAKSIGASSTVSLKNPQSISGSNIYSNAGTLGVSLNSSLSAFSKICVGDDMEVRGVIDADDIKVNGGQLSVSSELDDLKQRNRVLEGELTMLKAMLRSKGVL